MKRSLLIAGCAALAAGCSDLPVSSAPSREALPPGVEGLHSNELGYSGSAVLVPASAGGHVLATDLGMPVAQTDGWVEISLGGSIEVQTSPATFAECVRYAELGHNWILCDPPLNGASVPPEGVYRCSFSGCGFTLFVDRVCGRTCISPFHGDHNTGTARILFLPKGWSISASRRSESESWGSGQIHAYVYSGAHTLDVRSVPPPFSIAASEGSLAGDRNRRLKLASNAVDNVRWVFVPGDTAADPSFPTSLDSSPGIVDCNWRPECRVVVRSEGRMYVYGRTTNSGHGWVASPPIRIGGAPEPTPELMLVCGTARGSEIAVELIRGETFDCSVSVAPQQTFTVLGWTFRGSHTVPVPGAEPHTGFRWAGEMVSEGTVSVAAQVGTNVLSATVHVSVRPRPWVDQIAPATVNHFRCSEPLTALCPLPATPVYVHDLARTDPGPQFSPAAFRFIHSGPNAGFGYIPGESFVDVRDPWISINGVLQAPSDPFWRERRECVPTAVYHWALDHEMVHYEGLREFVEHQPTRGWMESATPFGTEEQVFEELLRAVQDFADARRQAADAYHTSPRFTNLPCDIRLDPGSRSPRIPGRDLR